VLDFFSADEAPMKKVVTRERNKPYYRLLHWPIWVWVFWILPGHLTHDLFLRGPDRRHWIWLAVVVALTGWRALAGRLPGCEPRPYVLYWGVHQPNLPYRVVCYTAAWIDLLVPFTLNFLGLVIASVTGVWHMDALYLYLYYPLAAAVALGTVFNLTPRARRSTFGEGTERAWFYIAMWTVVPSQLVAWAAWRLGSQLGFLGADLARIRLAAFVVIAAAFLSLGIRNLLPRTTAYSPEPRPAPSPETPA
jgi:hypothetical protein